MSPIGQTVGTAIVAYLLGCVDAGYYVVRYRTGRDIREQWARRDCLGPLVGSLSDFTAPRSVA
jgi:hypothetical protein